MTAVVGNGTCVLYPVHFSVSLVGFLDNVTHMFKGARIIMLCIHFLSCYKFTHDSLPSYRNFMVLSLYYSRDTRKVILSTG